MLQFFLLKSPHSKHVGHTVLERVRCLYCFSFVGILPIREKRPSRESIEMNFLGENMNRFKLSTLAGGILSACIATTGFAAEMEEEYDLIISNPPFYSDTYKSEDNQRNTARFTDTLPFKDLVIFAYQFLSEKGIFALILPRKEEENFIALASEVGLFPKRICRVKGNPTSEVKRSLMEFTFEKSEIIQEKLTIEISRHVYTEAYKNLVKDFYLKM